MSEHINEETGEVTQTAGDTKPTDTVKPPEADPQAPGLPNNPDLLDLPAVGDLGSLMDVQRFRQMTVVAKWFAASTIIPDHYRGKAANCLIAIDAAMRLHCHPLMFMQKTYIQSGKLNIEGALVIALVNQARERDDSTGRMEKLFDHPLRFRFEGEANKTRKCTAYTKWKASGELVEMTVTMQNVIDEGWYGDKDGMKPSKNGPGYPSKWKTMQDLMFTYRSAAWFARAHCPQVLLGMMEQTEVEDIEPSFETTARRVVENETPRGPDGREAPPMPTATATDMTCGKCGEKGHVTGTCPAPATNGKPETPPPPATESKDAPLGGGQMSAIWSEYRRKYGNDDSKMKAVFYKQLGVSTMKDVKASQFDALMSLIKGETPERTPGQEG